MLVHGDLMFRHVFVEDGRLTGIVDWGDAVAAGPPLRTGATPAQSVRRRQDAAADSPRCEQLAGGADVRPSSTRTGVLPPGRGPRPARQDGRVPQAARVVAAGRHRDPRRTRRPRLRRVMTRARRIGVASSSHALHRSPIDCQRRTTSLERRSHRGRARRSPCPIAHHRAGAPHGR